MSCFTEQKSCGHRQHAPQPHQSPRTPVRSRTALCLPTMRLWASVQRPALHGQSARPTPARRTIPRPQSTPHPTICRARQVHTLATQMEIPPLRARALHLHQRYPRPHSPTSHPLTRTWWRGIRGCEGGYRWLGDCGCLSPPAGVFRENPRSGRVVIGNSKHTLILQCMSSDSRRIWLGIRTAAGVVSCCSDVDLRRP